MVGHNTNIIARLIGYIDLSHCGFRFYFCIETGIPKSLNKGRLRLNTLQRAAEGWGAFIRYRFS